MRWKEGQLVKEEIKMNITFSWKAIVVIVLAMLPNIMYFISPPKDIPESLGSRIKLIETIENISRIISFVLLIFMSKNTDADLKSPWVIGMLVFLLLYFVLWGRYFFGGSSYSLLGKSFLGIPMPMAIFPVCYFICAAFWLGSIPAVIALVVFGISHILSVS